MDLFGATRSRVDARHALITPDCFVPTTLPQWGPLCKVTTVIAPRMGANFAQHLVLMGDTVIAPPAAPGVERVLYVLEGGGVIDGEPMLPGSFAYFPPESSARFTSYAAARICLFEKRYVPGVSEAPPLTIGHESLCPGEPFLGDPNARLQTLLPITEAFDLAVNVFTYDPGACLPLVEIHVMEHGLLMLDGMGIYRLGDAWYPVKAGDVIWMGPYCPQWFTAMGKTPARYLYYKNIHRDPLESPDA